VSRQHVEREVVELRSEMDRVNKSKTQVTSAVLDALSKEKSKTSSLERALSEMMPMPGVLSSGSPDTARDGEGSVVNTQPHYQPPVFTQRRTLTPEKYSPSSEEYDSYAAAFSYRRTEASTALPPSAAVHQLQMYVDQCMRCECFILMRV
jgi:hypothetical protein